MMIVRPMQSEDCIHNVDVSLKINLIGQTHTFNYGLILANMELYKTLWIGCFLTKFFRTNIQRLPLSFQVVFVKTLAVILCDTTLYSASQIPLRMTSNENNCSIAFSPKTARPIVIEAPCLAFIFNEFPRSPLPATP